MAAGRVIDAVSAAARGVALQAAELGDEATVIDELDAAAVQQRQEIAVEVALRLEGDGVFDAVSLESLARPSPP